jgi:hypothetical protein
MTMQTQTNTLGSVGVAPQTPLDSLLSQIESRVQSLPQLAGRFEKSMSALMNPRPQGVGVPVGTPAAPQTVESRLGAIVNVLDAYIARLDAVAQEFEQAI